MDGALSHGMRCLHIFVWILNEIEQEYGWYRGIFVPVRSNPDRDFFIPPDKTTTLRIKMEEI